jgi:pimeloyl-ACP methyl ester carboxylesterase
VDTGYVDVDGARLYFESGGRGHPVVLLHGGLVDGRSWDEQMPVLAERHRVVRVDLRGYGRSEAEPVSFSLVDDLDRVLSHLNLERVSLVGLSAGGGLAVEFALAHPDAIERLVLVGPGLPGFDWSEGMERLDADIERALESLDIDAAVEFTIDYWTVARRDKSTVDPSVLERVREMSRQLFEGPDIEEFERRDRTIIRRLSEISAPTLLIVGEQDVADIHRIAEIIERDVPNVRRESIPGGHHPNLDSPQRFNELVLSFLDQT